MSIFRRRKVEHDPRRMDEFIRTYVPIEQEERTLRALRALALIDDAYRWPANYTVTPDSIRNWLLKEID